MSNKIDVFILVISTTVSAGLIWFMISSTQTEAQINVANLLYTPFGGLNTITIPCTCSTNGCSAVYVGLPTPALTALYCPDTILYREYSPVIPTAWNLGQMSLPRECLVYAGYYCYSLTVEGAMYHEGTSPPGGGIGI